MIVYKKAKATREIGEFNKKDTTRNLSCGDEVTMYAKVEGDTIVDVYYRASGCAISMSSAYLLSKKAKGMKIQEFLSMSDDEFLKLIDLEGVGSARLKCALVPFVSLKRAIN
ncbi:MAG: iron-sulfur cluster assembly scaffold protein [Candidatus Altiarchaeota archaeon]|nr:iron-sulfur cluster assembly scaffold protein [Candidatus Altiarchaeota archaeon]